MQASGSLRSPARGLTGFWGDGFFGAQRCGPKGPDIIRYNLVVSPAVALLPAAATHFLAKRAEIQELDQTSSKRIPCSPWRSTVDLNSSSGSFIPVTVKTSASAVSGILNSVDSENRPG